MCLLSAPFFPDKEAVRKIAAVVSGEPAADGLN